MSDEPPSDPRSHDFIHSARRDEPPFNPDDPPGAVWSGGIEPPFTRVQGQTQTPGNLEGLLLLIHATEAEGRRIWIIDRSWYTKNLLAGHADELEGVDYIVVEDETWQAWQTYYTDNWRTEHRHVPHVCIICDAPGGILCEEHR